MSGKQVKLVSDLSDASAANDASGINFTGTGVTTFSSLTQLSTKFNVTDDSCGGGSPRFQINFGSQNVFVYLVLRRRSQAVRRTRSSRAAT
jgi:hypothetical protein